MGMTEQLEKIAKEVADGLAASSVEKSLLICGIERFLAVLPKQDQVGYFVQNYVAGTGFRWEQVDSMEGARALYLEAPVAPLASKCQCSASRTLIGYGCAHCDPRYAAAPIPPASEQRDTKRLDADALREPIDGNEWRVQWWNESCRMMLPAGMILDGFQSYRNGTLQFTIKKRPATAPAQGEA